jgi:hypothetical protein
VYELYGLTPEEIQIVEAAQEGQSTKAVKIAHPDLFEEKTTAPPT